MKTKKCKYVTLQNYPLLLSLLLLLSCNAPEYPHIIVKNSEKNNILQKIETQDWAKEIFEKTKKDIDTFVIIHQNDPEWILSRYLMNRVEGRRYTRFISDRDGTQLAGYDGDAPVPTVRVSPHKRGPVTPQGGSYRMPEIKDLIPNDTSMMMSLQNEGTGEYELIDPQSMVGRINRRFNNMVYEASVIYWLTGNERYAKFAADILNQWARGAYHQQPIEGPGRVGYLDIQTLGDEASKEMVLAYDFLLPYMKKNKYDMSYYETVFEKVAATLAFKGNTNNNWYAAESSTMVAAALALEDKNKRDYYLQFYLSKDTVNNNNGQLALPTTLDVWFTDDGHWREPGGYHNYPTLKLLESALLLEKNGYDVFGKFPQLFKSTYAMMHYSFPNLTASAYGDTGRPRQSTDCLEIGLLMADKYNMPIFDEILSVMQLLQKNGYDRSKNDITALLSFIPEISNKEVTPFGWNRSETLDFANAYYQRNGMDEENGMMYVVHGASYNHNHANGMAMELYGKGVVAGADPGNGPHYEHPMHVNYYAVWGAHNTVVAAGASSSIPRVMGGGGTKRMGEIDLISMEPLSKKDAVSEHYSFTDTKYLERSTNTNQQRTMALIRTSETTGYYLDIYRSDNMTSNDYLYHNEGDNVTLYNEKGDKIITRPATYPTVGEDIPGLRFFTEAQTTGIYEKPVKARFHSSKGKEGERFMDVWMPASANKRYYTAMAPPTKTIPAPYNRFPTPVLTIRTEKVSAWDDPFVAVFEPHRGSSTIKNVSRTISKDGVIVNVDRDNGSEIILHSSDNKKEITLGDAGMTGYFGIISSGKELYLGKGSMIKNGKYILQSTTTSDISASLTMNDNRLTVNTSSPAIMTIQDPLVKTAKLTTKEGAETTLTRPQQGDFKINIPEGKNEITF
jgi:Heparinase II/III-like protein.